MAEGPRLNAKGEEFMKLVRERFPETYGWARVDESVENFLDELKCQILTGQIGVVLGEESSPVAFRCWREIGMKCELNTRNLRRLREDDTDKDKK